MKYQDLETSRIQHSKTGRKRALRGFLLLTMKTDSPTLTLDSQTREFCCWVRPPHVVL